MEVNAMKSKAYFWSQRPLDADRTGEYEVRQIEQAWDCAVRSCDLDSLIEMMADDYVITNTRGNTADKPKILKSLKLSAFSNSATTSMDRDIAEVRVYGDTAIVLGRITWKAGAGEPSAERHSTGRQARYIKVYVKGPKGWQAVITQATRIEEEPAKNNTLSHLGHRPRR
jgi:ketosteroid isomerase-like protein